MAIDSSRALLSYDDYVALPDTGERFQVIDGVLVMSPSPTLRHQWIVMQLASSLNVFVRAHHAGAVFSAPTDAVLVRSRPAVVVQPDVMFVDRVNRSRLEASHLRGAPDLAVEVLSPSNARLDRGRKAALYAEHGVREYWVIPHDADCVEVYALSHEGTFGRPIVYAPGDRLETALLPGFGIDVAAIFPGPDDLRPDAQG